LKNCSCKRRTGFPVALKSLKRSNDAKQKKEETQNAKEKDQKKPRKSSLVFSLPPLGRGGLFATKGKKVKMCPKFTARGKEIKGERGGLAKGKFNK